MTRHMTQPIGRSTSVGAMLRRAMEESGDHDREAAKLALPTAAQPLHRHPARGDDPRARAGSTLSTGDTMVAREEVGLRSEKTVKLPQGRSSAEPRANEIPLQMRDRHWTRLSLPVKSVRSPRLSGSRRPSITSRPT